MASRVGVSQPACLPDITPLRYASASGSGRSPDNARERQLMPYGTIPLYAENTRIHHTHNGLLEAMVKSGVFSNRRIY